MDEQLQQLNTDLDAAVAEVKSVAAKSDATPEQIKAATDRMNAVKGRITAYREATDVDAWQNQVPAAPNGAKSATAPAVARDTTPLPQPGVETKSSDAANVGTTEIDILSGEIVTETGAGVLSQQQMKMQANPAFKSGFESWLRAGGDSTKMNGSKEIKSAFLEGRDDEGAPFVPAEVIAGIIKREPTPTKIVDMVRTVPITRGDRAQMVQANYDSDDLYSSAVRVYKTGEAQSAQKSDKPQFGLKAIDVHGWTAEISISNWMLADTGQDILGYFTEEFRTAIRNMSAHKCLLGNGVGEHFGILTRAAQANYGIKTTKSGDANKIAWDMLRKMKNAVPEQYEQNLRWLFNKTSTMDAIEEFKDADGRDLWPESQRSGGEAGTPGRLRGYPYTLEAFMPGIAANALPILFGDFKGYARVLRAGMTVQVLREIEARNQQTVFLVTYREGGDVTEPWRFQAGKVAA